jgi:hypothetical protein
MPSSRAFGPHTWVRRAAMTKGTRLSRQLKERLILAGLVGGSLAVALASTLLLV